MVVIARWSVVALVLFALACNTSSSFTTNLDRFKPRDDAAEEPPRGLSLSVGSVAADGTVTLELRNYSIEPFVFTGTPDRPSLVIDVESGDTYSRHKISSGRKHTHEVPAGQRLQLKAKVGGISGGVRIGIRHHEFGYVVWTDWFVP